MLPKYAEGRCVGTFRRSPGPEMGDRNGGKHHLGKGVQIYPAAQQKAASQITLLSTHKRPKADQLGIIIGLLLGLQPLHYPKEVVLHFCACT